MVNNSTNVNKTNNFLSPYVSFCQWERIFIFLKQNPVRKYMKYVFPAMIVVFLHLSWSTVEISSYPRHLEMCWISIDVCQTGRWKVSLLTWYLEMCWISIDVCQTGRWKVSLLTWYLEMCLISIDVCQTGRWKVSLLTWYLEMCWISIDVCQTGRWKASLLTSLLLLIIWMC
jgi:hypothetical protein